MQTTNDLPHPTHVLLSPPYLSDITTVTLTAPNSLLFNPAAFLASSLDVEVTPTVHSSHSYRSPPLRMLAVSILG